MRRPTDRAPEKSRTFPRRLSKLTKTPVHNFCLLLIQSFSDPTAPHLTITMLDSNLNGPNTFPPTMRGRLFWYILLHLRRFFHPSRHFTCAHVHLSSIFHLHVRPVYHKWRCFPTNFSIHDDRVFVPLALSREWLQQPLPSHARPPARPAGLCLSTFFIRPWESLTLLVQTGCWWWWWKTPGAKNDG